MGSTRASGSVSPPPGYAPNNVLTPPEQGWIAKTAAVLFMLALTVLAALAGQQAIRDGDDGAAIPIGCAMLFGSITVLFVVGIAAATLTEPVLEIADDRVGIGAPSASSDPGTYISVTLITCGAVWFTVGIATRITPFSVIGAVICVPSLWLLTLILLRGNRFTASVTVGRETIRLAQVGRVREFPWSAMSGVRGYHQATFRGNPRPEIEFHCYAAEVITHTGPAETIFVNDATIPRAYQINPIGMYVTPNALLATIEFMVAHPEQRAVMSLEEIAAMLTAR